MGIIPRAWKEGHVRPEEASDIRDESPGLLWALRVSADAQSDAGGGCPGQGPYLWGGAAWDGGGMRNGYSWIPMVWLLLRPVHLKEASDLQRTFSKALGGTSEVCPQGMGHSGSWRTSGWRRSERQRTGLMAGTVRGREEVRGRNVS